ncbi:MAG: hypothetical protein SGI86_12400 [Deltaproteobacteria bacterium]|nr:hypothetical protein [Deltaproteobacteria bacterium]
MRYDKGYGSFAEFEREELMRLDGATVDEMIDASFGEPLDFSAREASWYRDDNGKNGPIFE